MTSPLPYPFPGLIGYMPTSECLLAFAEVEQADIFWGFQRLSWLEEPVALTDIWIHSSFVR